MPPTAEPDRLARLLRQGPRPGKELQALLGLSEHALGRSLRAQPERFLRLGARKTSTYALVRSIQGVGSPVPIFAWGPTAAAPAEPLLHLVPIEPGGFAVVPAGGGPATRADNLPWFLQDLRPQGFLGRKVPRVLGNPRFPADIRGWGADDVLRYLCTAGRSTPGALVVGEAMRFAAAAHGYPLPRTTGEGSLIDVLAGQIAAGVDDPPPGSSAAGEQPKALSALVDETGVQELIVKYSPPLLDPIGRRVADLLVAEHLASEVIHDHWPGWAARSTVRLAHGRAWLLSRRFDRTPAGGRHGCVSLASVDAEFCDHPPGAPPRWSRTARALGAARRLNAEGVARVCLLEAFGHGIGNTDMHLGNLCLGLNGVEMDGVMPIYDMLPMAWMPNNELRPLGRLRPAPDDLRAEAAAVGPAVADFWARLEAEPRASSEFRAALAARAR